MHYSIERFCVSLLILWCLRNVIVSVSIRISTSFVVERLLFELFRVQKLWGYTFKCGAGLLLWGKWGLQLRFIWGCRTQISRSFLEISILNVVGCGKWTLHGKLTLGCANTSGESGCSGSVECLTRNFLFLQCINELGCNVIKMMPGMCPFFVEASSDVGNVCIMPRFQMWVLVDNSTSDFHILHRYELTMSLFWPQKQIV